MRKIRMLAVLLIIAMIAPLAPTIVSSAAPQADPGVKLGLEVLLEDPAYRQLLAGKNVALYTNQVFVDAEMNSAIKAYADAQDFNLVCMFGGEHGVRGNYQAGATVPNAVDVETGVYVWSLYGGGSTRPTADILRNVGNPVIGSLPIEERMVDVVLFDLPDIGSVTWTYLYTLADLMKSLIEFEMYYNTDGERIDQNGGVGHKIKLMVLDRPNPLGGLVVEGPIRDLRTSGNGDSNGIGTGGYWRFPLPSRYGMTMGELARMYAGEWTHNWAGSPATLNPAGGGSQNIALSGVDMTVIPCQGWTRDMYWDDWDPTGSRWILPSPNMPTWEAAFCYTGTVWHEGSNIGDRGTVPVWKLLYAPYINGYELAQRLNGFNLPGVIYRPAANTAINSSSQTANYPGRFCDGVEIHIVDKHAYRIIDDVILHCLVLRAMYGNANNANNNDGFYIANGMNNRLGNNIIRNALQNFPRGSSDAEIWAEFLRLKDIVENGSSANGVPGQSEFLSKRPLYLLPEYGSADPADYPHTQVPAAEPTVTLGYEALLANNKNLIEGKRVGLVANQTSVDKKMNHLADVLVGAGVNLTTLFAPVSGLRGLRQDVVITGTGTNERATYPGGTSYTDIPTGLPVYRLAGANTIPDAAMLANVDVLLFDIQDSEVRYDSMIDFMADCMLACADNGVAFVVLDRPALLGGHDVEGPVNELPGKYPIPIRYGMTIGELALMVKNEFGHYSGSSLDALELSVVKMKNWERGTNARDTGLQYVAPVGSATLTNSDGIVSPIKIAFYESAISYSAIGLIEASTLFDGLGTTRALEFIGAPGTALQNNLVAFKEALSALQLPGVGFRTTVQVPWNHAQLTAHGGKYANQTVYGVQLHIYDEYAFKSMDTVLAVLTTLNGMFPGLITAATFPAAFDVAAGNTWLKEMILDDYSAEDIIAAYQGDLDDFVAIRENYLLYGFPSSAYVSITGPAAVVTGAGATAEYTISADFKTAVSGVELEFEVDGDVLSSISYSEGPGFSFIGTGSYGTPILWKNVGSKWIGKVTLINMGTTDIVGEADILYMLFNVREGALGTTEVKLNYIKTSYKTGEISNVIVDDVAITALEKYFSPYDLNKDGVIDLDDLTFALQYLTVAIGDPDWEAAKVCDFHEDDVIDILDLIEILANYTIPYYS